jgi:hypothetical protein
MDRLFGDLPVGLFCRGLGREIALAGTRSSSRFEQARAAPLSALAVNVTDHFFLVGISSVDSERSQMPVLRLASTQPNSPIACRH